MSDRLEPLNLKNMTLRQKLSQADKLSRELIHHLEHGFLPKAHALRRTSRHGHDSDESGEVSDLTIRNSVDTVLASDDFTRQLADQLTQVLAAIDKDV